MSTLKDILIAHIQAQGPMTLAEYMQTCLLHPDHGYYATRDPFGAGGDFITAPEISQMFGELIGLSLAQSWLDQGQPQQFTLAELGPGRGTLMADILRATKGVTGFHQAANVVLVEASPTLRQIQRETLKAYKVSWTDTAADLPDTPLWLVANEFFDALPIRQFQRGDTGWCERLIHAQDGELGFGLAYETHFEFLAHRLDDTRPGDIVETCSPATAIIQVIGHRIETHGGAALVIDYGDWRSLGDTLQALRSHQPVDPLDAPGEADLTTHVDFEALAQTASCAYSRLTPQGVFLDRLGISQRAQALAKNMSEPALDAHAAAFHRLTDAQEMGTLFKVMALYPSSANPPPGVTA